MKIITANRNTGIKKKKVKYKSVRIDKSIFIYQQTKAEKKRFKLTN